VTPPLPPPLLFPYTTLFRSTVVFRPTNSEQLATDADSFREFLESKPRPAPLPPPIPYQAHALAIAQEPVFEREDAGVRVYRTAKDRKSTRLNSSHDQISYAV